MTQIVSINPASQVPLATLESTQAIEITNVLDKARRAFLSWSHLSYKERAHYILKAKDHVASHLEEFASLITRENGKPLYEVMTAEILPFLETADYFAKKTAEFLKGENVSLGKWRSLRVESRIEYVPAGVVGIISPWNYPFSIPGTQIIMALMAGNVVILKPSEAATLVAKKLEEAFQSAELPEGVLSVLVGGGDVGEALVKAGLQRIIFTGSTATGKKIMEAAAQTLTPVVLEMGGKDPMIICEDADLETASSAAVWGAFANSGQTCSSVERLYVHQEVAEEFIKLCLEKTQRLKQGEGRDLEMDVSVITLESQIKKIMAHVEDAVSKGADLLMGGTRLDPQARYYPPTILTDVDHSMELMKEETFGPVLPIMKVDSDEQALRLANDSHYALTASVWTRDLKRGKNLARELIAGTVYVNENVYSYALPHVPWGGPKFTGIGHTHGRQGLMQLVDIKHVHINKKRGVKDFWWFSYNRFIYQFMKAALILIYGKGLWVRTKALFRVLRFFPHTKRL